MKKGFIKGFRGSWGSGLGTLIIQDSETNEVDHVPCDNAPTVRALEGCFGNTIDDGHTVKSEPGFINKEIFWAYDDMGLTLEGFSPVEEVVL